jgi:hypothetical protein
MNLTDVLTVTMGLGAMAAWMSLGRVSSHELSRRLSCWGGITCGLSLAALCVVAEPQTDGAWQGLENLARLVAGLVGVVLALVFWRRLRRDQQVEAGLLSDHRNDIASVYARSRDRHDTASDALYRWGWACVMAAAVCFVIVVLTPGNPTFDESPLTTVVAVAGGVLLVIGRLILGTYRKRQARAEEG